MKLVVDFHVHVFPDLLDGVLDPSSASSLTGLTDKIRDRYSLFRKQARTLKRPFSGPIHQALTFTRLFPEMVRKNIDQLGAWLPLPGLIFESSPEDLSEALGEAGVDSAVVIAHPPFSSNEFVLEVCAAASPGRWIPAVNIPRKSANPSALLKKYAKQGAKILKLHPSYDGEDQHSTRYKKLLVTASDLGLPVIIHTGCIHSNLLFRNPHYGEVARFTRWFETYSDTRFVLAHMNYHDPQSALDLCEDYKNLYVDTSWQPVEVIGEAVRQIGAERVLFGTDWPILGDNIRVGKDRITEGVRTGLLKPKEAELILGGNAVKLLGLNSNATKI